MVGGQAVSIEYKVFKLSREFHQICDWRNYKIPLSEQRPGLLMVIEDSSYPDSVCCIPISKDDNKANKYRDIMIKHPDQVHPINMNQYDNYLLIQNMFYVRKEFIGSPFTVNNVHVEVKNTTQQEEILKKVKKMDALMKNGIVSRFVPRQQVYDIQMQYLLEKEQQQATPQTPNP